MTSLIQQAEIIAISGKQYAGKDLLAGLLLERLPDFKKIPIALAIKQAFAQQKGLTLNEIETNKAHYRAELIALGNWGRAQDADYWLKQVLNQPGKKLISDVRLKHEYDLLKANGAFLIRLEADRAIRAQRGHIVNETDPTETNLDDMQAWDWVIENNGTVENLKVQLERLLSTKSP